MSSDISHRMPLRMRLRTLSMRRITWPMRRGQFFPHIWNRWPRFAYSLSNLYFCTIKIYWVIPKIVCGPVLKTTQISAHAHHYVSLEWDGKAVTTIVLSDQHFLLRVSNFGDLPAFTAILAVFSVRMCINRYVWVSGENFDSRIRFFGPIYL